MAKLVPSIETGTVPLIIAARMSGNYRTVVSTISLYITPVR